MKNIYSNKFFPIIILLLTTQLITAQSFLNNPSFEDDPADATTPQEWMVCTSRSTPDILPGSWGVELEAEDGETYIGLITRQDQSKEHITQRLRPKFKKNACYQVAVSLAHSDVYAGYTGEAKINIWIGTKKCKLDQLIFSSPVIQNTDWKSFTTEFVSQKKSKYIYIEVLNPENKTNSKGHVLIDYLRLKECIRA